MTSTTNEDIRVGRVAGFPLAINWSVLVILWLLTWGLADGSLPAAAPGHSPGTYWVAGLTAAVLFFGSLLAHELAHAVVARRAGVEVKGVTLWLFGGVASLASEPATPRDDFRVAAVGPATSLALGIGFGAVAAALDGAGTAHLIVAVAGWLSGINLLLGVFNVIPGAPLDGGRLLRAFLWRRHGDRARAAITAAHAGRIVGYGLIGFGLLEFLAGASIGGLWLVFIGWFLLSAARAEEADVVTRQALGGVRVADVMSRDARIVPGWVTLDDFVDRYLLGSRHSAYPVEGFDGDVIGLVTLAQLRATARGERPAVRVSDVTIPLADVPIAAPDTPLVSLLEQLSTRTGGRALVFEHGELGSSGSSPRRTSPAPWTCARSAPTDRRRNCRPPDERHRRSLLDTDRTRTSGAAPPVRKYYFVSQTHAGVGEVMRVDEIPIATGETIVVVSDPRP